MVMTTMFDSKTINRLNNLFLFYHRRVNSEMKKIKLIEEKRIAMDKRERAFYELFSFQSEKDICLMKIKRYVYEFKYIYEKITQKTTNREESFLDILNTFTEESQQSSFIIGFIQLEIDDFEKTKKRVIRNGYFFSLKSIIKLENDIENEFLKRQENLKNKKIFSKELEDLNNFRDSCLLSNDSTLRGMLNDEDLSCNERDIVRIILRKRYENSKLNKPHS